MTNLTIMNQTQTMSSLELVKIINTIRKAEGNTSELRHDHFMDKIVKVLGEDHPNFRGIYLDSMNREKPCYYLPKRESNLMVISESYKVQAAVYDKMVELEQENTKLLKQQAELLKITVAIEKSKHDIGKYQSMSETRNLKLQALKDKLVRDKTVLESKTAKLLSQGALVKGDMAASKLSMPVDTITNLLKAHGSKLKPGEANNALINLGYLEPSRAEVTVRGSYYGRTIVSSKSAHTTLARWFPAEFETLLKEVDQYYADKASGLD